MDKIKELAEIIKNSKYVVVFSGAGASTDSGLRDFRGKNGLYNDRSYMGYEPEEILSHDFFFSHRDIFDRYLIEKLSINDIKPNAGHKAVAELEKMGKVKAVITQNIDDLHQAAGSKNVLELHGSIHRNYCQRCGKFYGAKYVKESEGIPICECGGTIKPDVVLYEESLDSEVIQQSVREIAQADMLIIGGTSLVVYPAAGFIDYFRGKHLVVINKSATPRDEQADLCIQKPIGEVLEGITV